MTMQLTKQKFIDFCKQIALNYGSEELYWYRLTNNTPSGLQKLQELQSKINITYPVFGFYSEHVIMEVDISSAYNNAFEVRVHNYLHIVFISVCVLNKEDFYDLRHEFHENITSYKMECHKR